MGAKEGNENAKKKDGIRIPVCLSISNDRGRSRRSWAVALTRQQGIAQPTDDDLRRAVLAWCYACIDEDMKEKGIV